MTIFIFEDVVNLDDVEKQDGGAAKIYELSNGESELFVRIQSWDETKQHKEFDLMLNKRIRVTVEILD